MVWADNSALNISASAARIVTAENFVPIRMLPFFQIGLATTSRLVTGQNISAKEAKRGD
jgi:uncharacterized membrane protein